MNIFKFRDQLIDEYRSYVTSFIRIADPRIKSYAETCFSKGALWPDPLIQLNPTFKPGKTIDELNAEGILHALCSEIFRRDKTSAAGSGLPLLLHVHQEMAIRKAKETRNYVLTTGTGSGKSLAYLIPIVDRIFRGVRTRVLRPSSYTLFGIQNTDGFKNAYRGLVAETLEKRDYRKANGVN